MARVSCSSCGLGSQRCQCHREVSTAGNANGERPFKLTRASFCVIYLLTILSFILSFICFYLLILFSSLFYIHPGPIQRSCYLEVFVDSVSVSNASSATADWNVSFVTKNPGNSCKVSLHVIKSSLLLGKKLISESFTPDYFGKLVNGKINEPLPYAGFKRVATRPQGVGGGVVWDLRVTVVTSVNINCLDSPDQGFLIVNCAGIPVNFTVDSAGNGKGSLLGQMRPCEYLFRNSYTDTTF